MINISISSNLLIIISSIILIAIIGLIVYIIYKDKMIDQEEIDDLIEDIVKAKPREKKKRMVWSTRRNKGTNKSNQRRNSQRRRSQKTFGRKSSWSKSRSRSCKSWK